MYVESAMYYLERQNKSNGTIYVYEVESVWNKEKKRPEPRQRLIGKRDPATNEIVPTRTRAKEQENSSPTPYQQLYCGATYLLDEIGKLTGVVRDLKVCFPESYKEILSLAYYMIMENESVVSRFHHWHRNHRHPCEHDLPSQRISELFASISQNQILRFCLLQAKRHADKEYWAVDTTSISSYSEELHQVKRGYNKDRENLEQMNLAILYGEQSLLPFYFQRIGGNCPDKTILKELLAHLRDSAFPKPKLVLDRGFFSRPNIDLLFMNRFKFLMGLPRNLKLVQGLVDEVYPKKDTFDHYDPGHEVFGFMKRITWEFKQPRPYIGDTVERKRRVYLYLYYSAQKEADDRIRYSRHLRELEKELVDKTPCKEHAAEYDRFFTVKDTPKRGRKVIPRQDAIDALRRGYGFFALLSNEKLDPPTALAIYRLRNVVETAFWDLKQRLDMKRTLVSSDASMDGKLFVQFVALIFLSYIKRKMTEAELLGKLTLNELLDDLDDIVIYLPPGKRPIYGPILKPQAALFEALGISCPS